MKNFLKLLCLACCLLIFYSQVDAQRILFEPVRAGQLKLFPEVEDGDTYYYLPDKPRLARNDQGELNFSFLRYVKNELSDGSSAESILESGIGGGIVHCLVELSVSDEMIKEAESALRRINGNGKIVGPVMFKSGTVALISAVANEKGEMAEQVLGIGTAPIMEDQKAAVAVQLNQLGSKILWETFNTSTPDFSFTFEMDVEGYLPPQRCLIEANWDRIYKHKSFDIGTKMQAGPVVMAGQIQKSMDELFDSGAIKVTQIGENEDLNKLKETAFAKLTDLMFNKVAGTGIKELSQIGNSGMSRYGGQGSMLDQASKNLTQARNEARQDNIRMEQQNQQNAQRTAHAASMLGITPGTGTANAAGTAAGTAATNAATTAANVATGGAAALGAGNGRIPPPPNQRRPPIPGLMTGQTGNAAQLPQKVPLPSLSVAASYRQKTIKQSGKFTIDLNQYTQEVRSMRFDYNPGNVKSECDNCFHEVNLDDPLMQQREVNASLGGINSEDFKYINFVNIILKKTHQNGDETVKELKIDKSKFNADGNFFRTVYGFKGDDDRDAWLNYDYRTMWSYMGGHTDETEWQSTEFGSIALSPTVIKKPVYIELDEDFVAEEKIRGVEIKFFTKLGESENTQRINLKAKNVEDFSRNVELLLPLQDESFDYEVTYFIKGADPKSSQRKTTSYGSIYIDYFM